MKTEFNSYQNSFLEYLELELNYSKKTIVTYNNCLNEYAIFLAKYKISFTKINNDQANKYKANLIEKGHENKTSALHLSAIRSFYSYLVEIKEINHNPFLSLKNPKVEKKLPNFLKISDEEAMFRDKSFNDDLTKRNYLILEFLYATGLRVSELTQIKVNNLNQDGSLKVFGKGAKERIVYYKACNLDLLNEYLTTVRLNILKGVSSEYLFVSKSGKPLTTRQVENIVKNYALKEGVKTKVTPHTLRHTYATDLLNNGANIRSVGELLGHTSLSTTQIYTHVTSERLQNVYRMTHPRSLEKERKEKK